MTGAQKTKTCSNCASLTRKLEEETANKAKVAKELLEKITITEKILSAVPVALISMHNNIIVQVNRFFLEMFQFSSQKQVLGRSMDSLLQDLHFPDNIKTALVSNQYFWWVNAKCHSRKGESMTVSVSRPPFFDKKSRNQDVLVVFDDITEQNRIESELHRMSNQAAFQSGLVSMGINVLHNIGNAVNAVNHQAFMAHQNSLELLKVADLLKQVTANEAQEKLIEIIDTTQKTIRSITIEKLAANTMEIQKGMEHISESIKIQQNMGLKKIMAEEIYLSEAIDNSLSIQFDVNQSLGIQINTKNLNRVGRVILPRNQLIQMMLNFLKNSQEAILQRFSGEGREGRIEISAQKIDDHYFDLMIKDNGCGVNSKNKEQLFKFGFSTKKRGSGFGLHFAANFIQYLGGKIKLESEGENCGSLITITLPVTFKDSTHG